MFESRQKRDYEFHGKPTILISGRLVFHNAKMLIPRRIHDILFQDDFCDFMAD